MDYFHIPFSPAIQSLKPVYKPHSSVISVTDKLWQLIRFSVVTGIIFVLAFALINFQAYKQILIATLNPDAQASTKETLEKVAGLSSVDNESFLPVLPDQKEVKKNPVFNFPIAPTDHRIIIPKIGKNVPIVNMTTEHIEGENWHELEKQIQQGLQQGIVHYPGTATPGEFGNVFLTGHSSFYPWDPGQFKDVFARLGQLEVGDEFYLYYGQKRFAYRVYNKEEVQPGNVSVLQQPADRKIVTLMTCTPVGTTLRRLIIHAEQIS